MDPDNIRFDGELGGVGPIHKLLGADVDGDGNADIIGQRESLFVGYFAGTLGNVGREDDYAAIDLAILPGGAAAPDHILVTDGVSLDVLSADPAGGLFPPLLASAFDLQPLHPELVAVAQGAPTVRGWIVSDGTEVTSFLWDGASATAAGGFTSPSPVLAICTLSAFGAAEEEVALLTDAGVGVYDSTGQLIFGRTGQAIGSHIARLPGSPGAPDFLVSILKQSGSNQKRIHVDSIAGSDPYVIAGNPAIGACAIIDIDCDGDHDLVLTRVAQKELIAVLNDGSLDHSSARFSNAPADCELLYSAPATATGAGAIAAFDLEGDGDIDLVHAPEDPANPQLELPFLRGGSTCAWALAPTLTSIPFAAIPDLDCDPATGDLSVTLAFELPSTPSMTALRFHILPPVPDLSEILIDEVEVQSNPMSWAPTQVVTVDLPFVPGADPDNRFLVVQAVELNGAATVKAWPPLTFMVGRDSQEVGSFIATTSAPACFAPGEISMLAEVCDDGGGGEQGGSTGGIGDPPPVTGRDGGG